MDPIQGLPREAFSVDQVEGVTGIGRTKIYEAISSGRLKARKYGKRTLILKDDLRQFLESLPPLILLIVLTIAGAGALSTLGRDSKARRSWQLAAAPLCG